MSSPTRILVTFCVGVAATLAWHSYGDAARQIIAKSHPQLGWLAPRAASIAPGAPSPDAQQLSLDAVRQNVDRIATTQEQITRNVDQLTASQEWMMRNVDQFTAGQERMMRNVDQLTAGQERMMRNMDQLTAGQEQMTREIVKLQDVEQQSLHKNSELPALSAPALARNPFAAVAGTDGALTTASAISMEALGNPHLFHFSLRSRCTAMLADWRPCRVLQSEHTDRFLVEAVGQPTDNSSAPPLCGCMADADSPVDRPSLAPAISPIPLPRWGQ